MVRNTPASAGDLRASGLIPGSRRSPGGGFDPWVRKISWRRAWQPTPVFFPGESRGQRRLVGYTVYGGHNLAIKEQEGNPGQM